MKTVVGWVLSLAVLIGGGVALEAATRVPNTVVSTRQATTLSNGSSTKSRPTARCTADLLLEAAGLTHAVPVPRFDCLHQWALVASGEGVHATFAVLAAVGSRWVRRAGGNLSELPYASLSSTSVSWGISLATLNQLVGGLGSAVAPDVAAAILPVELAARDATGFGGAYMASPVIHAKGGGWLATGWFNSGGGCDVEIYRWTRRSWLLQGVVDGVPCHGPAVGPGPGGGGITAEALTGSRAPDFGVNSGGTAGDTPFALVSEVHGAWQLVRFEAGYAATTDVSVLAVRGQDVETHLNACGCAVGPFTYLWETYRGGMFRPIAPPGPAPPCTNSALEDGGGIPASMTTISGPGPPALVQRTRFIRMACADGWALATGERRGVSHPLVGLFDQEGSRWRTVTLDDGSGIGLYPVTYDVPYTLLSTLARQLGSSLEPSAALGTLYTQLNPFNSNNYWTLSGVMSGDGSDWMIATIQPPDSSAVVNVEVFRWSGHAWTRQGSVDRIPDQGSIIGLDNWYGIVPIAGSNDPGFVVSDLDVSPTWSVVISDTGGTWHALP